ncbi:MAG TPA: GTPase Era [Sulfurovum sp.]|nr:MAG: GTPase Era [Sulfurovum sp. 35-42-20]OYZ25986.1 MAG: GTPase Era [Sulfurovum sp. 16-42-52]OZA42711.1 MAG: GTPase Era [Sulfurovum sp. 17-42-90]HQR73886.1 GTPase Era [Sulfurovum sp.]HQS73293.1 GTPase Era [Sulfurovum sp.]
MFDHAEEIDTKAGFVAVVGRPNAGKSTLLNHVVGEKLAMVSKKAQATRKRMNIIVMHEDSQIIFVDTPGIHEKERLLNQFMMEEALKAMGDSDLIVFLAPVTDKLAEYEKFLTLAQAKGVKHIVVLTKIDHVKQSDILAKLGEYQKYQASFEAIIPFSVNKKVGKKQLLDAISKQLPTSPFLYDTEILTTEHIRTIYKELIRESIFENLSDEIPYESDVTIERIEESDDLDKVYATIVVEKDTQKGMIVGQKGEGIKRVGKFAREQMEIFSGKKIFLDLHVAVKKGWSKNKDGLEEFGYII